jgi:hypothetical protein
MPPMMPGGPPAGQEGEWLWSPVYGWVWQEAPASGSPPPTDPNAPHPDQGLPIDQTPQPKG